MFPFDDVIMNDNAFMMSDYISCNQRTAPMSERQWSLYGFQITFNKKMTRISTGIYHSKLPFLMSGHVSSCINLLNALLVWKISSKFTEVMRNNRHMNHSWFDDNIWLAMSSNDFANFGVGNGLLPDCTKPLPDSVLTCIRWSTQKKHLNENSMNMGRVWKHHHS